MFIAMNRFKVRVGSEADFETVWKNRDSKLSELPGFESFHLLRGATNEEEGYTLYASHTVWRNRDDFVAWTKSEQFRRNYLQTLKTTEIATGSPDWAQISDMCEELSRKESAHCTGRRNVQWADL